VAKWLGCLTHDHRFMGSSPGHSIVFAFLGKTLSLNCLSPPRSTKGTCRAVLECVIGQAKSAFLGSQACSQSADLGVIWKVGRACHQAWISDYKPHFPYITFFEAHLPFTLPRFKDVEVILES